MTYQTPCQKPEANPDHWFIGRDGKQFADDEFLTEEERSLVARSVLKIAGETVIEHDERVDAAIRAAEATRKRAAQADRRHAKASCYNCYFRTNCLQQALDEEHATGTWGGYFEEEIREIRIERRRRRAVRRR